MGGYGSGRHGGRPLADYALRVDLARMMRQGQAKPGSLIWGTLHWTCGDEPSGSVSYETDMTNPDNATLTLRYTKGEGESRESVKQVIRLVWTRPHYGGRRWWMVCPYRGHRVGKLYLPRNGDRFASRTAWRLGYRSQRSAPHDKPFDRLNKLQRRLGGREGYEEYIRRPKGMWHRTFERHLARYWEINDDCDRIWLGMVAILGSKGVRV